MINKLLPHIQAVLLTGNHHQYASLYMVELETMHAHNFRVKHHQ
jgi:hypothetical protein